MKKRILAVIMAAVMTVGMSMTAAAAHEGAHGTGESEGAVVGETENFSKEDENYEGATQFYMNIDKDATNGEVTIVEPSILPGEGEICHYYIETQVSKKINLSATVPLYVCMYGYGGDGKVVAPGNNAYAISNSSKYSLTRTVQLINPCYQVHDIIPYGEYADTDKEYDTYISELNLYQKADDTDIMTYEAYAYLGSGEYGYYLAGETGKEKAIVVRKTDCMKHGADECENGAEGTYYFKDTTQALASAKGKNGTTVAAGTQEEIAKDKNLDITVSTIQTEVNTWTLKPAAEANSLKAGEIVMTLNGLDLNKVSSAADHTLDITGLKWNIGGGDKLSLPIQAQIAGGNVNEEGCVPVVKVSHTITPGENINEIN